MMKMNLKNKNEKFKLYLNKLVDGVIFSLLASLICYTFFYTILSLEFIYYFEIFSSNLIIWLLISLLSTKNKYILAVSSAIILIFIFCFFSFFKDDSIKYFADYLYWLQTSYPTAALFTDESFGLIFKSTIYFFVTVFLLPYYFFKSFSKFVISLWFILITILSITAYIYYNHNYLLLFILLIPLLFFLYRRATYNKLVKVDKEIPSYHTYQFKNFSIILLPILLLTLSINFLPLDYKNQVITDYVDTRATEIINEIDVLNRLSSRFSSTDSNTQFLGGDLYQSDIVRFKVKSDNPLLLRTEVFSEYTGDRFIKSDSYTISPLSFGQTIPESSEVFDSYSSYTIQMQNYNSRVLPINQCSYNILEESQKFTQNEFGEIFFEDYFIENDEFTINYINTNYRLIPLAQYLSSTNNLETTYLDTASDDCITNTFEIPSEALAELPDTVSLRTKELAEELESHIESIIYSIEDPNENSETITLFKNYMVTSHIVNYLQTNYTYSLTPGETIGDDFVDSFLFELETGYCTSFASSLYVLLRTLDIPCRYVSGYAVWENSPGNFIDVKDSNKHAWVEVYFKGVGYIPFDPTPSGPSGPTNYQEETTTEEFANEEFSPSEPFSATPIPLIPPESSIPSPIPETLISENEKTNSDYSLIILNIIIFISILALILIIYLSVKHYLKRKEDIVTRVMESKDFDVVFNSLIYLLSIIRLNQNENESIREFMRRVYKYDRPFGMDEDNFRRKKRSVYADFTPPLSIEMEKVIAIIEANLYSNDKFAGDIQSLIEFRERINNHIKETRSYIKYLIIFKDFKQKN